VLAISGCEGVVGRAPVHRRACAAVLTERDVAVSVVYGVMEIPLAHCPVRTPDGDAGSACVILFNSSLLRCTAKSLKRYPIG
jgi:hypothetical protein